uniref:C2H2-type domain-containing protein n=1 Tax=Strongyloides venezuelensis TaxID=75913 RepID=A0A0K0G344_STRVS
MGRRGCKRKNIFPLEVEYEDFTPKNDIFIGLEEKDILICRLGRCEKKFLDNETLRSHRLLEHGMELRFITDRIFIDKKSFDDWDMDKKEETYVKMSDIPMKIEKSLGQGFFCPFVRCNEDIIICSIDNCNRKFSDPEELDAHISLVHEESLESVRYFQCYTDHTHIEPLGLRDQQPEESTKQSTETPSEETKEVLSICQEESLIL